MRKPRILCTINGGMVYGDNIMFHSTLKDLSSAHDVIVMCNDPIPYNIISLYGPVYGIKILDSSQQHQFFRNDHVKSIHLTYIDTHNYSLRKLSHHAINCIREVAGLPLYDKSYNKELPSLPINLDALSKINKILQPLQKPIILTHPVVAAFHKTMNAEKYREIVSELTKLGTVIQAGVDVPGEYRVRKCVSLINQTSLEELIALTKAVDVIFCGDTFLQHVAAAMKTPTVVFWCGTTPMDVGYPFFSNLFHPEIATCQIKCSRPMGWLYDYVYVDKVHNDNEWRCPIKICDNAITVDEVVKAVEKELSIGRNRNWTFYELELSDFIPDVKGSYRRD